MALPIYGQKRPTVTLDQLHADCVAPWPSSSTRPLLYEDGVRAVHREVNTAGLPGWLWVGHDFVMTEEDPDHVGTAVRVPAGVLLTPAQEQVVVWLSTPKAEMPENKAVPADTYCILSVGPNDPDADIVKDIESALEDHFCNDSDGNPCGFPVIDL